MRGPVSSELADDVCGMIGNGGTVITENSHKNPLSSSTFSPDPPDESRPFQRHELLADLRQFRRPISIGQAFNVPIYEVGPIDAD